MESTQFDLTASNEDTATAIRKAVVERQVATFIFENRNFTYESIYNTFLAGQINIGNIKCVTESDEAVREMLKKPIYK